jgi:diacylglycerol O-acyltransferase
VPVATGEPDGARLGGNKVSNLLVSLRTDLADPLARLRAIHGLTVAAKRAHDLEIGGLLEDWAEYARPWLVRLVFSRLLRALPRPPINLVVSNLRGPVHPQFLAGAELVGIYLGGPLLERVGLNFTMWTYRDTVYLAAVSCPDVLPDLRGLLDECELALAELAELARGPAGVIPIDRAAAQRRQAAPG